MNEENILEKIGEIRAETSKISCYQNSQNKVLEKIQKEISNLKDLLQTFKALNGSDWQKYNRIKEILSDNQ